MGGVEMEQKHDGSSSRKEARRKVVFTIIGVGITLLGSLFIYEAQQAGWNTSIANFVQAMGSIALNYYLSRRFTWGDRNTGGWKQTAIRFVKVKAFTLTYNVLLYETAKAGYPLVLFVLYKFFPLLISFVQFFPVDIFAYWFSTGIITIFNFIAGNRYVFAEIKNAKPDESELEEKEVEESDQ